MQTTLTIIRGIPGSGKTTRAQQIARETGAAHHEADHYFERSGAYVFDPRRLSAAHRMCMDRTRQDLESGRSVVVANTFSRIWEMEPYVRIAEKTGADLQVIEATGRFQNIHSVPASVVQAMIDRWEAI